MGQGALIAAAVVSFVILIAIIIYAILDATGLIAKWQGKKHQGTGTRYPCLSADECGTLYGLSSLLYTCDPKLKQCRMRSYEPRSCTSSKDCLQVTSTCGMPVANRGKMCSSDPYNQGGLYGDPILPHGCQAGLILNTTWNFCQMDLGGPCKTSDECGQGACVNSHCQFLSGFDICTDDSSYGNRQCKTGLYCATNPRHPLSATRCQPDGITPGQTGAYCATDADCLNGDCYKIAPGDPIGQCAGGQGLVGMSCRHGGDCAQSLDCQIPSGQTEGTCVLANPAAQKDRSHCPPQYTDFTTNAGCVGAIFPVPCSSNICSQDRSGGCPVGNISGLVLSSLNPDQTWKILYPVLHQDFLGVFTTGFTGAPNGSIIIKPNVTMLLSPSQLEGTALETYPTINLVSPEPPPTIPVVPPQPRACQPLIGDTGLFSLFSNNSDHTVLFSVNYDPNNVTTSSVTVAFLNSILGGGSPVSHTMADAELYASFYQEPQPPAAANNIYVNCNYHGRYTKRAWPAVSEEGTLPLPWQGISGNVWLIPPPLLPANIQHADYLNNCLRFAEGDPLCVEPTILIHFFYHPRAGENVISWKFNVLPTQGGGGVTTLVGLYEVATPGGRRLVVSTLSIYTQLPDIALLTAEFASSGATTNIWAYRVPIATYSGLGVYTSVYSFVLVDFATNWPFTLQLAGPPSTMSDTAGLCNVDFPDTSRGISTVTTLAEHPESVPKFNGHYAVFTPRAYTRVQAATTLRTPSWTSPNLFGNTSPSLLDSDMVVIGTAGASSIIALSLVYSVTPVGGSTAPPQTLVLTMRFGDCMPTSRYSTPNIVTGAWANHTLMYGFYLTPEPEETGGGDATTTIPIPEVVKDAFPSPEIALTPVNTVDISSWATQPFTSRRQPPFNQPIRDGTGQYIAHHMRTPWGIEVFTATLVPSRLMPPVRFFRMPITSTTSLSARGADDVWIWGLDYDDRTAMRCVQLFFDNLGITKATLGSAFWISTAATSCPPTVAQVTLGQDHTYLISGSGNTYTFPPWNLSPTAIITSSQSSLQLTGRMCQTQGYQDGLLYRVRPYIFAAPTDPQNLPFQIGQILNDASTNLIVAGDLESTALALSSFASPNPTLNQDYQASLPLIGVGSIQALLGTSGSSHPLIPGVFLPDAQIVWVGSESTVPMLAGGYRTVACPANPKANPITTDSSYPTDCVDYPLTQTATDRKPLPICVIYRHNTGPQYLEMRMYDIRMNGNTATLISNTLVQTNGALPQMALPYSNSPPSGSWGGYPGFNGGPAIIYTACS